MLETANRMVRVHSDIRGPLYEESLKMMAKGIDVLRLNTGNPAVFGFELPASVRNAVVNGLDNAVAYCPSQGMNDARAAIVEYQTSKGFQGVTAKNVFIGNGVSELAQMLMLSLLNDGDEVLLPIPDYSLWSNCVYLGGGKPVYYRTDEKQNWYPDVNDIKSKITNRTKAVLIINPNNPTGVLYSKQVLLDILEVARQNKLLVISDEIYDRLVMDGKTHYSSAYLAPDLPIVTLNGLSKSHIICGFRCGWMVFTGKAEDIQPLRDCVAKLSTMRLCGNTVSQLVIPAALKDSQSTQNMLVPGGRFYEQRKVVVDAINSTDLLSVVPNDATFYVFPKLNTEKIKLTDKEFCFGLLKEKHILVIPGSGFEYPEHDHFRIVMLPEAHKLEKAMRDTIDYLESIAE